VPERLVGVATSLPGGAGAASSAALALARGLTEGVTMRVKLAVATGVLVAALGLTGGAALLSKAEAQPPVPAKTPPGAPPGMGAGVGGGSSPFAPPDGGGVPVAAGGFDGQPPVRTPPGAPPGMGGGAGGPPPTGTGGFPGGGFGPLGPGTGSFPGFSGIAAPTWEYKFVDFKGDRKAFESTVTANGREGWEFCTSERFGEGNRTETVLVFKKPKGGAPVFGGGGMFGGGGRGGDAGGGRAPGGGGIDLDINIPGIEARVLRLPPTTDAGKTTEAIKKVVGKDLHTVSELPGNRLLVLATPNGMRAAERAVNEMTGAPGGGGATGGTRPAPGGTGPMGGGPGGLGPVGPMGGFGPGGGGTPANDQLNVMHLKHALATELVPVLAKVFPTATLSADPRTNSIVVRGDANTMDMVRVLVARLDMEVSKPK
jgi:Bacterial type II/III secretion system short domain/Domain of unknown function (DUF4177)